MNPEGGSEKELKIFEGAYREGVEMAVYMAQRWVEVAENTVFKIEQTNSETGTTQMVNDPNPESRTKTPLNQLPLHPSTIIEDEIIASSLSPEGSLPIQKRIISEVLEVDIDSAEPISIVEEKMGAASDNPDDRVKVKTFNTSIPGVYLKEVIFLKDGGSQDREWTITTDPESQLLDPSEQN